MIHEVWTNDVTYWSTKENPWRTVHEACQEWAKAVMVTRYLKDAYVLRSDAGAEEANRVHFVLVFDSMEDRHAYYREGGSDAVMKMAAKHKDYFRYPPVSHYYYQVVK